MEESQKTIKNLLISDESLFEINKNKAEQVQELGGLDPVDIKIWAGDDVNWSSGFKGNKKENQANLKELLKTATITDATETTRSNSQSGKFEGEISVKFDDGSVLVIENQKLLVYDHVTATEESPDDALVVQFMLGEGVKVEDKNPETA